MSQNHHRHRGGGGGRGGPSKFGGNFIDPFQEIFIDPFQAGGFEVKEEEGKVVVMVKGIFQVREEDVAAAAAAAGNPLPINNNNNTIIHHLNLSSSPSDSSLPMLQRDLSRLTLSSSSSSSSSSSYDSSRPPQLHFPWVVDTAMGTNGCTKILTINEIGLKLGTTEIRGEVECSKCHQTSTIGFDLQSEFVEIAEEIIYYKHINYYGNNLNGLHCPDEWLHPKLPPCPNCCLDDADQVQPNSPSSCYLKPVIPENHCDYDRINWLFLFLGQMLGCCTVEQLNFFCKHSTSDYLHRQTGGAKDRLLFLTYLSLCKQLLPIGQFDYPIPS